MTVLAKTLAECASILNQRRTSSFDLCENRHGEWYITEYPEDESEPIAWTVADKITQESGYTFIFTC